MESLPPLMGIYVISNTVTGQQYVGHTHNLYARQHRHLADLRRGAHCNPRLQQAFDRDGEQALHFAVLAVVDRAADLPAREAAFIAALQPAYNRRQLATNFGPAFPVSTTEPTRAGGRAVMLADTGCATPSAPSMPNVPSKATPRPLRRRQSLASSNSAAASAPARTEAAWQEAEHPQHMARRNSSRLVPERALREVPGRLHHDTRVESSVALGGATFPAPPAPLATRVAGKWNAPARATTADGVRTPSAVVARAGAQPRYPAEMRAQAVRLVQTGEQSIRETARVLGISRETLRRWRKQAGSAQVQRDRQTQTAARPHDASPGAQEDVCQLRQENHLLRAERALLLEVLSFVATLVRATRY